MEKYYEVTKEHQLHGDYFKWEANAKLTNEIVKEFMEAHNIQAREYAAASDALHIVATDQDKETFKTALPKSHDRGLYKFKANSKIHRAWIDFLKHKNHTVMHKPRVIFYISVGGGRFSSRLFHQNGKLYCSFSPAPDNTPEGFVEMKASEFFKIIEESEAS